MTDFGQRPPREGCEKRKENRNDTKQPGGFPGAQPEVLTARVLHEEQLWARRPGGGSAFPKERGRRQEPTGRTAGGCGITAVTAMLGFIKL